MLERLVRKADVAEVDPGEVRRFRRQEPCRRDSAVMRRTRSRGSPGGARAVRRATARPRRMPRSMRRSRASRRRACGIDRSSPASFIVGVGDHHLSTLQPGQVPRLRRRHHRHRVRGGRVVDAGVGHVPSPVHERCRGPRRPPPALRDEPPRRSAPRARRARRRDRSGSAGCTTTPRRHPRRNASSMRSRSRAARPPTSSIGTSTTRRPVSAITSKNGGYAGVGSTTSPSPPSTARAISTPRSTSGTSCTHAGSVIQP